MNDVASRAMLSVIAEESDTLTDKSGSAVICITTFSVTVELSRTAIPSTSTNSNDSEIVLVSDTDTKNTLTYCEVESVTAELSDLFTKLFTSALTLSVSEVVSDTDRVLATEAETESVTPLVSDLFIKLLISSRTLSVTTLLSDTDTL